MASRPGAQSTVDKRRESRCGGEPVRSNDRKVQKHGDSLYINLPPIAIDKLDSGKGRELEVETYHDRVVIKRKAEP